jgi:hypothetical protein
LLFADSSQKTSKKCIACPGRIDDLDLRRRDMQPYFAIDTSFRAEFAPLYYDERVVPVENAALNIWLLAARKDPCFVIIWEAD